jgi:hypothetical protein
VASESDDDNDDADHDRRREGYQQKSDEPSPTVEACWAAAALLIEAVASRFVLPQDSKV